MAGGAWKFMKEYDLGTLPVFRPFRRMFSFVSVKPGLVRPAKEYLYGELAEALRQRVPLHQALFLCALPPRRDTMFLRSVRRLAERLLPSVEAGWPLSEAMRRCGSVFEFREIRMIEAGEQWDSLPRTLKRLAQYQSRRVTETTAKSLMAYPVVLAIVACSIMTFVCTVILPKFSDILAQLGAPPPPSFRRLMWMAGRLSELWPWILVTGAVLGLLVRHLKRMERKRGGDFEILVYIPIVGRARVRQLEACWLAALASAVDAGIPAPEALRAAGKICGGRIGRRSEEAARAVERGSGIGEACISRRVLRPWLNHQLQLLDCHGNFADGLWVIADDADLEAQESLTRFFHIAEVAGIALVAVIVAITVLGIYSALISIPKTIM